MSVNQRKHNEKYNKKAHFDIQYAQLEWGYLRLLYQHKAFHPININIMFHIKLYGTVYFSTIVHLLFQVL